MTVPPTCDPPRPPPLAGVRVLDLSRLLPGPLCAQHLCELGATVIKIEDPGAGDYARPAMRELVNRGKIGLTLNLKCDEGREIFFQLLANADVVLEGFRPGVMQRLGLDYAELSRRRPSLVYCAISGYGQSGARRHAAGHDINYLSRSGVLDMTGEGGGPPVIPGFLISDILGGTLSAATGILAALVEARQTGRGRFIDVSMTDAVMAHNVLPLAEYNESGSVHARGTGSHTGGAARYRTYAARDGRFLAVGAQEKKFWDLLCDALELPELKPLHSPDDARAPDVERLLRRAFATRDAADWLSVLEPLDCCVTAVRSFEEALRDPDFRSRGTVRAPAADAPMSLGLPFVVSELAPSAPKAAPRQGEHTDTVLGELGFGRDTIASLRSRGVI
ncbi:Formyl-coenzyme A transferase [Variovorax sp. SRS16]|uniref:CaiB/BaiF CoA transferase family protein n=1 Tax=Variovorax sp. SRS16 TaxID=282217 RepID=UPI001316E332|nr:CaiB/BaiF CoA-transferase family protein [Variovorax sp. SRS16]VTU30775.1 Formyl-coenzyme A transferase [Variovorax sp. SRS16]